MSITFDVVDRLHKIVVKFIKAYLPEAKKEYYLKPVHETVLTIHDVASKAATYNIGTSPEVIEEGMNAGMRLILYLLADGFSISTLIFILKTRFGGEYSGRETALNEGVFPEARLQPTAFMRNYLRKNVQVEFDGKDDTSGLIDQVATKGHVLTIRGLGLKITADESHQGEVSFFFHNVSSGAHIPAILAVNEPKTLKVVVPASLTDGGIYQLVIRTQSAIRSPGTLLKELREMRSSFALQAVSP